MFDPPEWRDRDAMATFLSELFGSASGDRVLSAEMPPGWRSERFGPDGLDAAVEWVLRLGRRALGFYVRMTTVDPAAVFGGRGLAEHSHELVCLWADLDYGTAGHKPGPGSLPLPSDAEAALKLTDGLPTPSILVDSGHGLHGYRLLSEPVLITEESRSVITSLSARWQQAIKANGARRLGYGYGAGVGDLPRVLRLPGTVNRKPDCPERPVRVLERTGERFTLAQLSEAAEGLLEPVTDHGPEPATDLDWLAVRPTTEDSGPFDILASEASWADILGPVGWRRVRPNDSGTEEAWQRPGGTHPISAKVLKVNPAVIVNWSEDSGLPTGAGQRLTKGRVYAYLHFNGNTSAAGRALRHGDAPGLPGPVLARVAAALSPLSLPPVPVLITASSPTPAHRTRTTRSRRSGTSCRGSTGTSCGLSPRRRCSSRGRCSRSGAR